MRLYPGFLKQSPQLSFPRFQVSPDRWCVTRLDLKYLHVQVLEAVQAGQIFSRSQLDSGGEWEGQASDIFLHGGMVAWTNIERSHAVHHVCRNKCPSSQYSVLLGDLAAPPALQDGMISLFSDSTKVRMADGSGKVSASLAFAFRLVEPDVRSSLNQTSAKSMMLKVPPRF